MFSELFDKYVETTDLINLTNFFFSLIYELLIVITNKNQVNN